MVCAPCMACAIGIARDYDTRAPDHKAHRLLRCVVLMCLEWHKSKLCELHKYDSGAGDMLHFNGIVSVPSAHGYNARKIE